MGKEEILDEIRRLADENDGTPPGVRRFASETGIRESTWAGKYWARWSDALREAGFEPNAWSTTGYDDVWVIERLVELVRNLGKFPTKYEISLCSRDDPEFPSEGAFKRRGTKAELAQQTIDWCQSRSGYDDVIRICTPVAEKKRTRKPQPDPDQGATGFVYLLKAGRHYEIGHSNSVARREYELSIQLPEKATIVHQIETDDPPGIEAYWHKRFADKRQNGEWFALTAANVRAFKRRRRFM